MSRINEYLADIIVRPKIFSPRECNLIINNHNLRASGANIGADKRYGFAYRYPLTLDENSLWIQQRVIRILNLVNHKYFQFKIDYLKDLQLLEYREGCFFDWHI